MDENKQWMASGKIGCTFAALFAKAPEKIGWVTIVNPETFTVPEHAFILSLQFPGKKIREVIDWAITQGFYVDDLSNGCVGLRRRFDDGISWVQYIGPDSHAETRRAPVPELIMTVKLPIKFYWRVGFKGILHLAHASVANLRAGAADILWRSSFDNTRRKLGHEPTYKEAAKTTYINE